MKTTFSNSGPILLGALILTYQGLFNGYPFVYPDTASYIFTGFDGRVPIDRPLTYGLFIRHLSMMESAVWVIFAQALLTSWFIFVFLKVLLPRYTTSIFLGTILFLTLASDASLYVSYLLPDLFTPLAYGALGLMLFANPDRKQTIGLCLLAWLSLMMHNSNLLGASIVTLIVLMRRFFSKDRSRQGLRQSLAALGIVVLGWLGLNTLHYTYAGGFQILSGRHMFLMARLNEFGILKKYLDQACTESNNYKICAYKDQIPEDFLWHPDSPVNKTGGWKANKKEYNQIIGDILTTPTYLKTYLIETLNGAAIQFARIDAEYPGEMLQTTPTYTAIQDKFPFERYTYSISRQNHSQAYLDTARRTARQQFFFFVSLMIGVLLATSDAWRDKVPITVRQLYGFVMMTLVVNALICSAFSTIVARYQGRLVWLLFLISLVAVFHRIAGIKFSTLGWRMAAGGVDPEPRPPID